MIATASIDAAEHAAERFFRTFARQCHAPDEDTLFTLLEALHSLNDKLRKAGKGNFFNSAEFGALRALRNLFHHQAELLHEVKAVSLAGLPLTTDLAFLCLVERSLVELALQPVKDDEREAVTQSINWYGTVTDIQPCIFNAAVVVFEEVRRAGLGIVARDYVCFAESYDLETERGFSHRVTGRISCRAGDVDQVLATLFELA